MSWLKRFSKKERADDRAKKLQKEAEERRDRFNIFRNVTPVLTAPADRLHEFEEQERRRREQQAHDFRQLWEEQRTFFQEHINQHAQFMQQQLINRPGLHTQDEVPQGLFTTTHRVNLAARLNDAPIERQEVKHRKIPKRNLPDWF